MGISINQDGDFHVIELSGQLDALAVQELRPDVEPLLDQARRIFLVEGREIDMLDSSGIGFLVHMFKTATSKGNKLALVGLQGQADDMIRFLKIDQVVPCYPSLSAAKQAMAAD